MASLLGVAKTDFWVEMVLIKAAECGILFLFFTHRSSSSSYHSSSYHSRCSNDTSPTSLDLPRHTTRSSFILPWICFHSQHTHPFSSLPQGPHAFPRHATLIARPLASLPKPTPCLLNETRMTDRTILWSIILLSRTVPTNHAISVLIGMIAFCIMTFVAGEHF